MKRKRKHAFLKAQRDKSLAEFALKRKKTEFVFPALAYDKLKHVFTNHGPMLPYRQLCRLYRRVHGCRMLTDKETSLSDFFYDGADLLHHSGVFEAHGKKLGGKDTLWRLSAPSPNSASVSTQVANLAVAEDASVVPHDTNNTPHPPPPPLPPHVPPISPELPLNAASMQPPPPPSTQTESTCRALPAQTDNIASMSPPQSRLTSAAAATLPPIASNHGSGDAPTSNGSASHPPDTTPHGSCDDSAADQVLPDATF